MRGEDRSFWTSEFTKLSPPAGKRNELDTGTERAIQKPKDAGRKANLWSRARRGVGGKPALTACHEAGLNPQLWSRLEMLQKRSSS